MSEANKSLRRKLFLARKAAEAVEKRGNNAEGDYTYARAERESAEPVDFEAARRVRDRTRRGPTADRRAS